MELSISDKFAIFEQLSLHQCYIDNDPSRASVDKYLSLYWPEATFTVHDLRSQTFTGFEGLKNLYDYAHSVFPIGRWSHSMGWFEITGINETKASVQWRWCER